MKFDSILIRILDWIKRVFAFAEKPTEAKPYVAIRSIMFEGRGQLDLVMGRDTEMAVRTWRFIPERKLANIIYICLDSLEQESGQRRRSLFRKTHRIEILAVSRYKNVDGYFGTKVLHAQDYDLIGFTAATDVNRYARIIVDRTVFITKYLDVADIDWGYEIEKERAIVLDLPPPQKPWLVTTAMKLLYFFAWII